MEIFNVENFNVLLKYKWDTFGKSWHLVGFFAHMTYMTLLTVYTYLIYIMDSEAGLEEKPIREVMEWLLVVGIIYPASYDFSQILKDGVREYFSHFGNYLDMLYIWSSIVNVILQRTLES